MSDKDIFREKLQSLISKFEKDKAYYLSKGYTGSSGKNRFFKPFFKRLTGA